MKAGRRERKKERTRQALLGAATELFAERGIYATRVEDITNRADLGKGAFYNYFEAKEAIVAELVSKGTRILDSNYLSRLNGADSIQTRIADVVRVHEEFFEENPIFVLLFHQARGMLNLAKTRSTRLRDIFDEYLGSIGRALIPPDASERWTAEDRLDLAALVAGGIAGYRSFRLATGVRPNPGTARESLAIGVAHVLSRRSIR